MKRRWLLGVLAVLSSGLLFAEASPRLVLPEIPGYINPDGKGAYQKVLQAAAQKAGLTFTAQVLPRARALALFLAGSADGVFTFTQTAREKLGANAVLASYPIGAYRGYAFVRADQPPVHQFSQLTGRVAGGVVGFEGTYGSISGAGASIEVVNTDAQNLAKLKAGRIDVLLGFLPDLFELLPDLAYDPAKPFFEAYDRLTLRNTPENRAWLVRFSEALRGLHASGEVRALVGPAYLPVSGEFPPDR